MTNDGRRNIRSKGKRVEVPANCQREIISLSRRGHSISKISELTGYSRWTVARVLREAQSATKVERERASTVAQSEDDSQEAAQSEVANIPEPTDAVDKAVADLASLILAAYDQALATTGTLQSAVDSMGGISTDLHALWERAERITLMRESLDAALSAYKLMEAKLSEYMFKLDAAEQKNIERAMIDNLQNGPFTGEADCMRFLC